MAIAEATRVYDLRSAIEEVEAGGELVRVRRPVDPGYELPNVLRSNALQPKRPALLFENVEGFPGWRVAAAFLADHERSCRLFGLPADHALFKRRVMDLLDERVPPVVVEDAPCQQNVVDRDIDLRRLIPSTHGALHVSHRYFQGPVITRDPETGRQNLGIYRTCIQGPDTATVNGRWDRHLGYQLSHVKRSGAPMPVAVVLGPDPLWTQVAATKLPYGADDFGFIGAVRGRSVELVRCRTVDLMVPANAEVVIEGEFRPPYELGDDGPWPEYLNYLGMNIHPPLIHVTCVTHRDNPISYMIVPGGGGDNHGMLTAPVLLRHLRSFASTFVVDCALVPGTRMHHAIVQVRKTEAHHEGLQLNVALSAFGHLVELDRVTLVDDDIDIHDPAQVAWAEATRCNPAQQVHILCEARTHQNNPIGGVKEMFGQPITRAKMIVDATVPWQYRTAEKAPGITFFSRSEWQAVDLGDYYPPEEAERWVKKRAQGILRA